MFRKLIFLTLLAPTHSIAAPTVGEALAKVELSGDKGGLVSGNAWTSESIKGKVWTLFYVDPDKKDINELLENTIKAEKFSREKFGSIAVINMAATWLPNGIISSSIESKQEKFPLTTYVKDKDKVLVKEWKLADETYDVMIFDATGKLRYYKSGTLEKSDVDTFIALIKELIAGI
jgi:predicted transcriptional regulator